MLARENEAKKRSSQGALEYAHKDEVGKRNIKVNQRAKQTKNSNEVGWK